MFWAAARCCAPYSPPAHPPSSPPPPSGPQTTQLAAPAGAGAGAGAPGFAPLTVSFGAGAGRGELRADGLACTLTLISSGKLVTVVYRVLDPDTLAVSMTEVPSDDEKAVLSEGFMFRVLDAGRPSPPSSLSPGRASA